jgi:hypothetical protein
MNYELAKQLKDAGFNHALRWSNYGTLDVSAMPAPTLSELIEVCGIDFGQLQRGEWAYRPHEKDEGVCTWLARSTGLYEYIPPDWSEEYKKERAGHPEHSFLYGHGHTPEEAVARLWLALKKAMA